MTALTRRAVIAGATSTALAGTALAAVSCTPTEAPAAPAALSSLIREFHVVDQAWNELLDLREEHETTWFDYAVEHDLDRHTAEERQGDHPVLPILREIDVAERPLIARHNELIDEVLVLPCTAIDEIKAKASFLLTLDDVRDDTLPEKAMQTLLRSLLGGGAS